MRYKTESYLFGRTECDLRDKNGTTKVQCHGCQNEDWSLFRRMEWSIVPNAALRSRDTSTVDMPWSIEWEILSRVRSKAVSVEFYLRYADWKGLKFICRLTLIMPFPSFKWCVRSFVSSFIPSFKWCVRINSISVIDATFSSFNKSTSKTTNLNLDFTKKNPVNETKQNE